MIGVQDRANPPPSVIVVYPDEFLSHSIAQALEKKGLRIQRFESAGEGWAALKVSPVTAIIVPFDEPEMGCLGLLRRVRSEPGSVGVAVVLFKGDLGDEDVFDAYRSGADLVLKVEDPNLPSQIADLLGS